MNESSYDVYVGNLSVAISDQNLKDLFSNVGYVLSVWVKRRYRIYTYAFVRFKYFCDAKTACEKFQNKNIAGFEIKVKLSKKTLEKVNSVVKNRNCEGVLLELPKRGKKVKTKEDQLTDILRRQLGETDTETVRHYFEAIKEAQGINANTFEICKAEPEKNTVQTLEDIVTRYYTHTEKSMSLFKEVDYDLCKRKGGM